MVDCALTNIKLVAVVLPNVVEVDAPCEGWRHHTQSVPSPLCNIIITTTSRGHPTADTNHRTCCSSLLGNSENCEHFAPWLSDKDIWQIRRMTSANSEQFLCFLYSITMSEV